MRYGAIIPELIYCEDVNLMYKMRDVQELEKKSLPLYKLDWSELDRKNRRSTVKWLASHEVKNPESLYLLSRNYITCNSGLNFLNGVLQVKVG